MTRTITVEHDGIKYTGYVATIKRTRLGVEDHGIFTADLSLEWPGGGVSIGGYALDSYDKEEKRRLGTAYGLDHIAEIMRTVGVGYWENLTGRQVVVLFPFDENGNTWGSMAAGIANLIDESKVFLPKAHVEAWRAREAAKGE